jgi:kynurenine formamidase
VTPEGKGGDTFITAGQLEKVLESPECEALILRTLPNSPEKRTRQYSGTNPPYLLEGAAKYLAVKGITQLLVDLPSVDKEDDGGALLAHKAFWNFPGPLRMQAMITEMVYVPDDIPDGSYFLDLQVASFENDASPSRPVLYKARLQ